jgi:type III secretion system chaperone SycN
MMENHGAGSHRAIVEEFMNRIGLKDTTNAGANPAVFDLQGLGQLSLETVEDDDDLVMSLAVPLPPYEEERLLAALRLCYPDRVPPFPLLCGLHHDHLVFTSRQDHAGLTAARLENQAMFLIDSAKAAGF